MQSAAGFSGRQVLTDRPARHFGNLLSHSFHRLPLCSRPRLAAQQLSQRKQQTCTTWGHWQRHAACCEQATLEPPAKRTGGSKTHDVVALGNLCLDIVVPVEQIPSNNVAVRQRLLAELEASPSDRSAWEVGANSNFMIAAARLGMKVASVANIGDDQYGQFLREVLWEEGVYHLYPLAPHAFREELKRTLLCFVLIGPEAQHGFCSRYDFGPWPLLPGVDSLTPATCKVLEDTHALFLNGFIFDELPARVVLEAVMHARRAGAAVFFDAGPRCWTLLQGQRRAALDAILDVTDVVLMTQEEAQAVTGEADPEAAAAHILNRPHSQTRWCVVKMGGEGAVLCSCHPSENFRQHALKVDVKDTVGCGDSFAAAVVLGYTRKQAIPQIMALANAVGAATAMGAGAGRNVANAPTVLSLLASAADSAPTHPPVQRAAGHGSRNGSSNGSRYSVEHGEAAHGLHDPIAVSGAIQLLQQTLRGTEAVR